ncbi:hypothetical protein QVD17_19949 [Tagetes erecta]|uniref:Uncharacterized protein n=1 Tax=Tagetes erecta TaxID=13708 RepID=A0AAD8KP01_TARER|nr:hypothetical protein QVD17_19949 [Tagetes erecta]
MIVFGSESELSSSENVDDDNVIEDAPAHSSNSDEVQMGENILAEEESAEYDDSHCFDVSIFDNELTEVAEVVVQLLAESVLEVYSEKTPELEAEKTMDVTDDTPELDS